MRAPGTEAGVTGLEDADSGPCPTELAACTVKVYDVQFVNPVTVHGDPEQYWLLSDQVTQYPLMGPPSEVGAVQVNVACALPAVADTLVGIPGTLPGAALEAIDASPVPFELVAVTVKE